MGDLTTNFSSWEFECGCGCKLCCPSLDFVDMLELTRLHYGRAIRVLSGSRCDSHNASVGGSKHSSHLKNISNGTIENVSFAGDLFVANTEDAYRLVAACILADFKRIGFKPSSGFIHIDTDPYKTSPHMWDYSNG